MDAIIHFPIPTNITDRRSWFGLVDQAAYSFSMTDEMLPFRNLLKNLTCLFSKSKNIIADQIRHCITSFQLGKPTCLSTDWCQHGIGFILSQKSCNCDIENAPTCCPKGWNIVFAGSRFTTGAESRYAPIEGEALAVTYALEKCRMLVLGCPTLIVTVNHEPLVRLLGNGDLHDIANPRLLRLKEENLQYSYSIKYLLGKRNVAADTLSRHSHSEPDTPGSLIDAITEASVTGILASVDTLHDYQSVTWDRVQTESCKDPVLSDFAELVTTGFPEHKQSLPP